jgi:hypothetical protein
LPGRSPRQQGTPPVTDRRSCGSWWPARRSTRSWRCCGSSHSPGGRWSTRGRCRCAPLRRWEVNDHISYFLHAATRLIALGRGPYPKDSQSNANAWGRASGRAFNLGSCTHRFTGTLSSDGERHASLHRPPIITMLPWLLRVEIGAALGPRKGARGGNG